MGETKRRVGEGGRELRDRCYDAVAGDINICENVEFCQEKNALLPRTHAGATTIILYFLSTKSSARNVQMERTRERVSVSP